MNSIARAEPTKPEHRIKIEMLEDKNSESTGQGFSDCGLGVASAPRSSRNASCVWLTKSEDVGCGGSGLGALSRVVFWGKSGSVLPAMNGCVAAAGVSWAKEPERQILRTIWSYHKNHIELFSSFGLIGDLRVWLISSFCSFLQIRVVGRVWSRVQSFQTLLAFMGLIMPASPVNLVSPMNTRPEVFYIPCSRRRLLHSLALATAGFTTQGALAEALSLTPRQTEGPYYPDHLPLDQDSDLIHVQGDAVAALGTVTNFGGRLLNADGKPVSNASIELWQADNNGCYIHSKGTQKGKERDAHFQGFGKITTNEKGEYRFRTILPGLYTGRTRHYHIAVMKEGKRMLTTQLYIAGEPMNEKDGVLRGIKDPVQHLSVIREFKPVTAESKELVATWDIVMGTTPEDREPRGRAPGPGAPPPGGKPERRPPPR